MEYFKSNYEVYFAKLHPKAVIPHKETENAGYDFFATFDDDYIEIEPGERKLLPTGIVWASSPDFYLHIFERSSTGLKGIKVNSGVIDSGYRGEIKVVIFNTRKENLIFSNLSEEDLKLKYPELNNKPIYFYSTQKAIAQGIINRVEKMEIKEISYDDILKISSSRGNNAWGSSNKK